MSSDNPPYPYYNGIPFNPSFFTSDSGSGLTQSTANTLYLRKTVPDTASALETFNGGIIAPSLSSTGSLNIVMPNVLSTDVLNVGVVSRNISGQIHHYSDGDNCVAGSGVHINNGNTNASNTNISNGTTTTGQVNIMTGATSSGTVTIGSSTITNSINGTTTITGPTNINTTGVLSNVNIGSPSLGSHTISGNSVTLNGNTNNITGSTNNMTGAINLNGIGSTDASLITIGNVSAGGITTFASDTINIGNADTITTMNATNIKQSMKTFGNVIIENVIGDTSIVPSMSTTFNRKFITPLTGAIGLFTISANAIAQFTSQYFEIVVSGCNAGRGSYTYKGCFGVEKIDGGNMTPSSVSTLFYFGTGISPPTTSVVPVIGFATTTQVLTVTINTSGGNSTDQNFIATLISYPSCSRRASAPQLEDFLITAY